MHKVPGNASPNEHHIGDDGSLQSGLKETQFRVLPSAEQTRDKLDELETKTAAVTAAEDALQQRIQDAKEAIQADEERLRQARIAFDDERKAFESKKKKQAD